MGEALETRTYDVAGMTCEHCRRAVADEVATVDGVTAVEVDLDAGRMAVHGHGLVDAAIAAAVAEAGYELLP